ncbi:hypothetical protein [Flavobacterium ustbae]|uniref:hypothetical protein n=1 Tax=Flavobacterium ustbae TaxID=2488790 RepID=UPI000F7877AB|nr:hypothetical protein [Flavobacterium ustbae]
MEKKFVLQALTFIRKLKIKIFGKQLKVFQILPQYSYQQASDIIRESLEFDKPCMIARFGSVELDCLEYIRKLEKSLISRSFEYIKGDIDLIGRETNVEYCMQNNAGFFPTDEASLKKFSKLMLDSMKDLDILGSWLHKEKIFEKELAHVRTVGLGDLEPYHHENPWSKVLKGKKVLVIHPFEVSIKSQYSRREFLFDNIDVLPDFKLITYKPVVSFAGNSLVTGFESWFEALEFMKREIEKIDFEVAIIGCGAYGFPLASYIKKIGKKSVHLGGATQILFGIKGKRWEHESFNDYWIRPSPEERPENFKHVEGGCYW